MWRNLPNVLLWQGLNPAYSVAASSLRNQMMTLTIYCRYIYNTYVGQVEIHQGRMIDQNKDFAQVLWMLWCCFAVSFRNFPSKPGSGISTMLLWRPIQVDNTRASHTQNGNGVPASRMRLNKNICLECLNHLMNWQTRERCWLVKTFLARNEIMMAVQGARVETY